MFSTILGLAGDVYGAVSASNQAAKDRALRERMFNKQMDMQQLQLGLASDAQRAQTEENAYNRQIERLNRLLKQQERQFELDQLAENKRYNMEQRRVDIERQLAEDKEAARIQAFNLENLLQRQDISEQEREFAVQQLQEAKAVAAGERDEDKRRFYEEREMAQMEREFLTSQFMDAREQSYNEREDQLRNRDLILNQIFGMQSAVRDTAQGLGYVPTIDPISRADIDAEVASRTSDYIGDVDRAADRVASVNEAGLIRAGLDESTPGTARRGEITARIADEYNKARLKAQDDAIKYITGESNVLTGNVRDIMDQRGRMLAETGSIYNTGIDQLMQTPQASSAVDAYRLAQMIPSGIYNRTISSANAFDAPIPIGTAAVSGSLTPGLADYSRPTSLSTNQGFNIDSGVMAPYGITIPDPSSFYSNAIGIGNNLYNAASSMYDQSASKAYEAGKGFGQSFDKLLADQSATEGSFINKLDNRTNDYFSSLLGLG